jgi:membrane protease YdiL (CAAX protease family)
MPRRLAYDRLFPTLSYRCSLASGFMFCHRFVGNPLAIAASADLFAVLHAPTDLAHAAFFMIGGIDGWIRVASRTTTAPTLTHVVCNLILLVSVT